jgi:small subunit ribosomal protein S2
MSDATPEAIASAAAGGATAGATPHPIHSDVTIRDLLDAGVHFGHQTQRWNPRMKSFLFGERNGVHIIDLDQTLPRFEAALDFVRETTASGGKVLFVGTKRQAQAPIQLEAQRASQFYVNNRWLGGMLTNFKTVKKSIERFKQLLEIVGDEAKVAEYPKKELARINRQIDKYKKSLDGIREMSRLPDLVFVVDVSKEEIAVSEARRLGIPIVAVVDSNCSPDGIDFVVPGNDDAIRAIQLYGARVADACLEGAALHDERVRAEVAEATQARASGEGSARPGGRVVVEITQPPRRGRAASFGRDPDREDTPSPAAPPPPAPAPDAGTEG